MKWMIISAAALTSLCYLNAGCAVMRSESSAGGNEAVGASGEDLNGAQGNIFKVNEKGKCFELLKETVIDPKTNEGRSRHTIYWNDKTRFVKVTKQDSFAGVDKPVVARFRNLDEANAKAAAEGKPFIVMEAILLAENENASEWNDDRYIVGKFTADPGAANIRGGVVELNGRVVPVRLRGPRAEVFIRTPASARDISKGFWETAIRGDCKDGRFVASKMDITALPDPRLTDDPELPRILMIGDSISMLYDTAAREALKGIANYHRNEGNGGSSERGVVCAELWLGDYTQKGLQWDVIQFNHGLHDLKQVYDEKTGKYTTYAVSLEDYKANLKKEIQILKKTGAKLVWCTTTPVPQNSVGVWDGITMGRQKDEDLIFNKAAMEVISKHPEIAVNDINRFIRGSHAFDKWREQKDVHFWDQTLARLCGEAVADRLKKVLREVNGCTLEAFPFELRR